MFWNPLRRQQVFLLSNVRFDQDGTQALVTSALDSMPGLKVVIALHGTPSFNRDTETKLGHPDVHWLDLAPEVGNAKGLNAAAEYAKANGATHFVVTQANVVFHEDCLARLVESFQRSSVTGAVGPITNHCWSNFNQVQHSPNFRVFEDRKVKILNEEGRPETAVVVRLAEVPYTSGFCWVTSRRVFDAVGPMDEGYPPLCGHEDDWLLRARVAGYLLYVDFGAFAFNSGLEIDRTKRLNLGLMKERAAERLIDKFQLANRELLYTARELTREERRRMAAVMAGTKALLVDRSGYEDYLIPDIPELKIEVETPPA